MALRTISTFCFACLAYACTYVEVPFDDSGSKTGTSYLSARSGELVDGLDYEVKVVPRSEGKHGFVSIDTTLAKFRIVTDGLNEAGLALSMNGFAGAEYEGNGVHHGHNELIFLNVASRVLAQCANVSEALDWFADHKIFGVKKKLPGVHWALADATGRSVVVEYLEGWREVFDNEEYRVMTNDPPLDWHWSNLMIYANVTSDLAGLPSDLSSESRFQQAYYIRKFAADPQPGSLDDAIVVGTGLLNRLYIPFKSSGSFTPFGVLKIPSQRRLLWRGYTNLQWNDVQLDRVDFSQAASWPVEDGSLGLADALTNVNASAPRSAIWTLLCGIAVFTLLGLLGVGVACAWHRRTKTAQSLTSTSGVSMLVHGA